MYAVRRTQALTGATGLIEVVAPHVARSARAGQFVIVIAGEHGERIPLTIADHDRDRGTITLVVQAVGKSTEEMLTLEAGDAFTSVAGPLGHPTKLARHGTVVCVAGGVGVAPIYPIARDLKAVGNHVVSVLGARRADLLFWQDRMARVCDEVVVCTDDGSAGRRGLVTDPLVERLQRMSDAGEPMPHVWAIGPTIMMRAVSRATEPFGAPTTVSLNTIMVDGTGMCGGCRVSVSDGAKFVCVDGPEFDGHDVDWDNLLGRITYYRPEEREALEAAHARHTGCVRETVALR